MRLVEQHIVDDAVSVVETPIVDAQPEVVSRVTTSLQPLVSATERALINTLVQQLATQIPLALAIAVLHATADMPLAHAGNSRTISPASLAVQFGRIARLSIEMTARVSPQEGPPQEIICASDQQIHMLSPIGEQQWWLYMAVETKDTNLAIARSLMQTACAAFPGAPSGEAPTT